MLPNVMVFHVDLFALQLIVVSLFYSCWWLSSLPLQLYLLWFTILENGLFLAYITLADWIFISYSFISYVITVMSEFRKKNDW